MQCLLTVATTLSALTMATSVKEAMEKGGVIPDVVKEPAEQWLQVEWKASGVKAEGGNELAPSQVKSAPLLQWSGVGPDDMHLVCMLDPDAPSRQDPRARHWLHWLVANVPGGVVSKGEVVAAYVGAGPPKGTGLHRYVLLVFKQPKKLRMDEVRIGADSGKGRSSFSVSKLLGKYKLPAAPVASNFFQAQWDQYVPTLHKQLAK